MAAPKLGRDGNFPGGEIQATGLDMANSFVVGIDNTGSTDSGSDTLPEDCTLFYVWCSDDFYFAYGDAPSADSGKAALPKNAFIPVALPAAAGQKVAARAVTDASATLHVIPAK